MSKPQAKHSKGKMSSTRQVNNGQIRKVNMTHRKMAFGDKKRATRLCLLTASRISDSHIWIFHNPARCFDWERVTPSLEDTFIP